MSVQHIFRGDFDRYGIVAGSADANSTTVNAGAGTWATLVIDNIVREDAVGFKWVPSSHYFRNDTGQTLLCDIYASAYLTNGADSKYEMRLQYEPDGGAYATVAGSTAVSMTSTTVGANIVLLAEKVAIGPSGKVHVQILASNTADNTSVRSPILSISGRPLIE